MGRWVIACRDANGRELFLSITGAWTTDANSALRFFNEEYEVYSYLHFHVIDGYALEV